MNFLRAATTPELLRETACLAIPLLSALGAKEA